MNFPILRLMKNDFINYYNQANFSKLIIQYQILGPDTGPYVYLVFYAFNTQNNPMHTLPINLIFDPSDPVVIIDPVFYLGNIELSKEFIAGGLSSSDFSYFSFKAEKSMFDYIGFEISSNKILYMKIKNPCPPDCPLFVPPPPQDQSY